MLNVAIIGAGAISAAHIEGYLRFPERCRIVAICDLYPEKAQARADRYGLDAKVVSDWRELGGMQLDLVSVCTPPYTHAETAIHFLSAGSDVLIEKPMAASLEECDRIADAARQAGRLVSVVAQNRFRDPMMKLKSVLDSGLAGRILHAQADSYWWRGHSYYDLWWRGTWEKEGGGPTLNHAVHHIDALLWMRGRPSEVTAFMGNVAHDNAEVEDLSIAMLRYPDGTLGQIASSVVHHGEEQQLVFQGTNARVSAPWKAVASTSRANGFPEPNRELEEKLRRHYESLPSLAHEGHAGQIDDVLSAIEAGVQPLVGAEDGRAALELITAIYKSAATGEAARLPLQPDDPFYTREGVLRHAPRFHKKKSSVENFADIGITTGSPLEPKNGP